MRSFARLLTIVSLPALVAAPLASALTADTWTGLPLNPSVLTLQKEGIAKRAPNTSAAITSASVSNLAAGSGVRWRGTLTPSVSGNHQFAISGSKNVVLWLSSDDSRFHKQPVAWHHETTTPLQWTKFASQQSAAIPLVAGTSYYIEVQVMSSAAGGHLALGWKTPGSSTIQTIPMANLSPIVADPADGNDNGLPDTWDTQTGLAVSEIPGALFEFADPDNDGISNRDEFLLGSNPLAKESRANGLTRDTWTEIQGQTVSSLTAARARFFSDPNSTTHVPGVDETYPNKIEGKNYGARFRGFLVAPATGAYHLWIAGDDEAELWFADGTVLHPDTGVPLANRFGKQLLAHTRNPGGAYSRAYRDFDLIPSQRSRAVHLVQGESYYLEVLHKNESITTNHVSLAWEIPGADRAIIPASAFQSDLPEDSDRDNDALPDAWETAKGLSITDNGFTSALQGQYGDHDQDGVSNLLEFQLGTNPKAADTDGDGLADGEEINYHGTNPLVPNVIATTHLLNLNLAASSARSFPWETLADGSIRCYERRGWIEWQFTVPPGGEGIHEMRLTGGADGGSVRGTENLPISLLLNGDLLARQTMVCKLGQNTTVKQITPWLNAGTHTLRIQNHNVRAGCNLRINSIALHRLGGIDADSNGLADWAEAKFHGENKLTRFPAESLTSPAYIEGITSSFAGLRLTREIAGVAPEVQPALPGVNGGFYAHVPLDPAAPVAVQVGFENGAYTASQSITWAATNILAHPTLAVRQGASLRLTAHDSLTAPSGTFALTGSEGGPTLPTGSQPADAPVIVSFDTPGTHTVTATWTPAEGAAQTATLTVTVHAADFGPVFDLQTYNRRTWNVSGANDMDIEADTELFWNETTADGAANRSFLVNAYHAGTFRVIARLPATGEIIACGEVRAFSLARAGMTGDAQIVDVRPDGSQVIRFTIVAENLPANAEIRLHLQYQGSTFQDGGRDLVLRPSDFSSNGVADIIVETSSDPPQLCHTMHAILLE